MFDLKRRIGLTSLFLLLVAGLLVSCSAGAEKRLRGYAQDFITALDVDVVEEKHSVLIALYHIDAPNSRISSEYIVSDAPEEVKEKLMAFHLAEEGWLAPDKNGWIGTKVSSLSQGHPTPEQMKEDLEECYLPERDSGVGFFLICPWYRVKDYLADDGSFYTSFLYMNYVVLTTSGKLVVRIRDTKKWYSSCFTTFEPKT